MDNAQADIANGFLTIYRGLLSAGKLTVQGISSVLIRTGCACCKQQVQGHEEIDDGDKHQ